MKKKELLVPAGNMECLKQAVINGCDAVYLACKSFGARKFATNFTREEIKEAISYCHLYGVRLYVTMNTLIKDREVPSFIEQASFLHQNGVDALIVQDFGMICLLRETFPNLEIHASTQANISSKEVCKLYHDLGVKRVVFSRELSIDEIDSIDVDIEKEVFIHGALCISYSGCCLMSSMLGGRSGNRGECAGVCRMPFSLYKENTCIRKNEYLLSTKELNTSHQIKRLLNSKIDSFKIEGRMKGPLYVGFITRFYRKLIDGESFKIQEENQLKTIFNREFTEGRLLNTSDINLMNPKSPNHIGLEIGKVIAYSKDKIKIQLNPNQTLHQGDAIRFQASQEGFIVNYLYDEKKNLTSSSTSICYVDNKIQLNKLDTVSKTGDYLLEKEFNTIKEKKIPIKIEVFAKKGKPLRVEIQDEKNHLIEESNIVEAAKNAPLSEEDITRQLSKLGDTPFTCKKIHIEMDQNIFLPLRTLNEIRRSLIEKLIEKRKRIKIEYIKTIPVFEKEIINKEESTIHCSISNEEQLSTCISKGSNIIYTKEEELYSKYKKHHNIYYVVPRCIQNIMDSCKERNLVGDYASYSKTETIGDYGLNVMNSYTVYYLKKLGIKKICLSTELTEEECEFLKEEYEKKFGTIPMIVLTYGRVENMIIKGNILGLEQHQKNYYLVDSQKRKFPVFYDGRLTHILNHEIRKYENLSNDFIKRYDFYNETTNDINLILQSK